MFPTSEVVAPFALRRNVLLPLPAGEGRGEGQAPYVCWGGRKTCSGNFTDPSRLILIAFTVPTSDDIVPFAAAKGTRPSARLTAERLRKPVSRLDPGGESGDVVLASAVVGERDQAFHSLAQSRRREPLRHLLGTDLVGESVDAEEQNVSRRELHGVERDLDPRLASEKVA